VVSSTVSIPPAARELMVGCRIATLATLSPAGQPRLVPICFTLGETGPAGSTLIWSPLDAKPKRDADVRRLARVRDILERPHVTLLFERWSEDWSELAWVRVRGLATLVEPDDDADAHPRVVASLRMRYPQYLRQPIDRSPLIRIAVTAVTSWSATPGPTVEPG
jgi:coenzyme F420-0:L-glutamate ligase / coenzyme F420-1:gamma-L-glutamate ligase